MSESKQILNSEEVDFLLDTAATPADETVAKPGAKQVVTMRGDLQQMHLADIFQTIGLAKMEGLLKVSNAVEQRLIHFREGLVRILVPPRTATRRLGQRLIQAGLLDGEQFRLALLEQRRDKSNASLGKILVRGGYVPQRQIDELVAMQVTEELFGLFTWEHGEFEFYRGPVEDPDFKARIEACHEFESNTLLLEVARRADEWEDILAALRSLDEIPLPQPEKAATARLSEEHRALLQAVDGRLTYRELSDITCSSVFDCARAARDLMNQGLIAPADEYHLLDVARWHYDQGHGKKALMLARTLCDRPGDRAIGLVREVAQLIRTVGEPRLACQVILETAQLQTDPALALELATEARAMSPRDLSALGFLRTTMLAHLEQDSPEIEQVTLDLLDGLLHDGDTERVLSLVDEAVFLGTCTPAIMVRQARALTKRKDNTAAIDVLLRAGETYAEQGEPHRQLEVLELAFRLDRERKDLHKLIKQLRSTPRARMVRWGSVAVVTLTLLATGTMWLTGQMREQRLMVAGTEITGLLGADDLAGAELALTKWRDQLGDSPQLDDLDQQLRFAQATQKKQLQREAMRAASDRMHEAGELLLRGEFKAAFALYDKLDDDPNLADEVADAVRARLSALIREFDEANQSLPDLLPAPPQELAEQEYVEETLTMLRRRVPPRLIEAAQRVVALATADELPASIPEDRRKSIVDSATSALVLLERGQRLTQAFEAASLRFETQRRLDPLFKAALDHERALEFEQALDAYRRLLEARAGTADLTEHLQGKVRQLEGIVGMCAAIAAATRAGDFATANRDLQALKLAEPDIPFDQVVRLPVTVRTSIPGALVRWNGTDIGKTPQLVSYLPGGENNLELRLDGFFDMRLGLPSGHGGHLDAVMTVRPTWSTETQGIDRPMAIDDRGRVYATERDAAVTCFDARTGERLWRFESNDLAGYLTPPQVHLGTVVVGSLDGPLRAFDGPTGRILWQRPQLATEFAPAMMDGRLVIATTSGELLLLTPSSGEEVYRVRLPAPVLGDLVAIGTTVFAPLADGSVVAYNATDLVALWRCQPRQFGTDLVPSKRGLIAQRDDGQVSMLDPTTGRAMWQRYLPSTPIGVPTADADHLLVTLDNRLILLELGDGRESWAAPRGKDGWAGPARFLAGKLAVPTRAGSILVFTTEGQSPRYRIPGGRGVSLLSADGVCALVAAGQQLSCFPRLP